MLQESPMTERKYSVDEIESKSKKSHPSGGKAGRKNGKRRQRSPHNYIEE